MAVRARQPAAPARHPTPPAPPAPQVLLHQTVIGEEALEQLAMVGEKPDLLVGCTGGGRCGAAALTAGAAVAVSSRA